ncbi:hypothetical protein [Oceanibacterium hippocampi]|uniref:Terminase-like family protein n=1 Tax=Oceanibacterium hippocampi TaxID=745714 RepID=A0A1Y5TZH0_9PROT|nr:hypothetical protein [Oceanibacterium hippocampi]SLN77369.1 hypothetical protein OCH7691_04389 [Oceanibacterium hippocampi]
MAVTHETDFADPKTHRVAALRRFVVGVDLGQSVDPTAIAIIEHITEGTGKCEYRPDKSRWEIGIERQELRHLERLPLGKSYPEIVDYTALLMQRPPLVGNASLVIDQSGVGRPVFDLFKKIGVPAVGVTITAGESSMKVADDQWRASKTELISTLEARLHVGALKIASGLSEASVLAAEMKDFRRHVTAAGRATFSARVGAHDDLVLAAAISLWYGQRKQYRVGVGRIAGL